MYKYTKSVKFYVHFKHSGNNDKLYKNIHNKARKHHVYGLLSLAPPVGLELSFMIILNCKNSSEFPYQRHLQQIGIIVSYYLNVGFNDR